MTLAIKELGPGALELEADGILGKADYDAFVPAAERCIEDHGQVNLLVHITGFHGWSPAALWEDVRFDVRHYEDVGRLALVGSNRLHEWMAKLRHPFTKAEVHYYDAEDLDEARAWVTVAA